MSQQRQQHPSPGVTSEQTHIVAKTPDLRVVEYVLQPGEYLPWHHHSEVTDHFYCLEGAIGVELREPAQKLLLRPGESCTVPPGAVHRSGNAGEGVSRYLLVQGIGRYDFVKAE